MKTLRRVLLFIIAAYAMIILLSSLPISQKWLANWIADALSDKLKTEVHVGSINIGFGSSIIINDLEATDLNSKRMLSVSRLSVSFNPLSLLKGEVELHTAQIYGIRANVYQESAEEDFNIQFVIDAFSSQDDDGGTTPDININTLIVNHADIAFHRHFLPEQKDVLDVNHLEIRNLSFRVSSFSLSGNNIEASLKKLKLTEQHSQLQLSNLSFNLVADDKKAEVNDFCLAFPSSQITSDTLKLSYPHFSNEGRISFERFCVNAVLFPADFAFVLPCLSTINYSYNLFTSVAKGSTSDFNVNSFRLMSEDNDLVFDAEGGMSIHDKSVESATFDLHRFHASAQQLTNWYKVFANDEFVSNALSTLQQIDISARGNMNSGKMQAQCSILSPAINADISAEYDKMNNTQISVDCKDINLGALLNMSELGNAIFTADVTLNNKTEKLEAANVAIHQLQALNHTYNKIEIEADDLPHESHLNLLVDDPNLRLAFSTLLTKHKDSSTASITTSFCDFSPGALGFMPKSVNETYSAEISANLTNIPSDIFSIAKHWQSIYGNISIDNLCITSAKDTVRYDDISIDVNNQDGRHLYAIACPFLSAEIVSNETIDKFPAALTSALSHRLPSLLPQSHHPIISDFDINATLTDARILNHFVPDLNLQIHKPIHVDANINGQGESVRINVESPHISYGGTDYQNLGISLCDTPDKALLLDASFVSDMYPSSRKIQLHSKLLDDKLTNNLKLLSTSKTTTIDADLNIDATLSRMDGALATDISINPSTLSVNDTLWSISPSTLHIHGKNIHIENLHIEGSESYLHAEGTVSSNPTDSMRVSMKNLPLAYILNLANFHSVRFDGEASGEATLCNLFDKPDFTAEINVRDFTFEDGRMGNALIHGSWDNSVDGIALRAHITDWLTLPADEFNSTERHLHATTDVKGYVSPANQYLDLSVSADNTNLEFLNSFLSTAFSEIHGSLQGNVNIVGPFNDVNLLGDAHTDLMLRLGATNVAYHIAPSNTLRLRNHSFAFTDIELTDAHGSTTVVNGEVTHNNFMNFTYDFNASLHNSLVIEQPQFNSDRYKSTLLADGSASVSGKEGHPLYINATITPTQGSYFAYDNWGPEAVSSGSYIRYHNRRKDTPVNSDDIISKVSSNLPSDTSANHEEKISYEDDIYMNVNLNMTPDCEVKVKMDNTEEGYLTTAGHGTLKASFYNKGDFQMFGTYNIDRGSYRLFFQNLIYRDLNLQEGSSVKFNGNPFDAELNLICHHTINAVPLSDLTATAAYSQTGKTRVVCILNITGNLTNMDFNFGLDLPTANDETKQLVHSMINSEEEMNTQIIYLLGFGRFYPNEFSRANTTMTAGDSQTLNAVNSLVSNTLSGQINNVLSSLIGPSRNWTFGTTLSTGERGWNDLDVEGLVNGTLFDNRLLINGNFGYRDNTLTNQANFIGDFEVKWQIHPPLHLYLKAYNKANERYFTKSSLNTQGIGVSIVHPFQSFRKFFNTKNKQKSQPVKK